MFSTYYMKTVVNDDTLHTFVFLYHSGMPHLKILQKQTNTLVHTAIILLPEPFLWKMDIVCKFEVAPKLEGLLRDASCALKPILTLCWLCFDLCLWCMFMVKVAKNLYACCSYNLIICSTCFGHLYAYHQELETILMLLPHMVFGTVRIKRYN